MTAGLAFFLFAVALVVAVVVQQSLAGRRRRLADQSSRLELLSSISTLEEVQKELFRRKTLAAMGQLAGGVSHDLRNPLAVIRNSTHLLRTLGDDPEKADEYITLIEKQVERADKIITNLLDFSRTATTEPAPVDLKDFFDSLVEEFPAPEGIEIEHGPHDANSLRIDSSQLRQIVVNILNNAVQAIGSANGRVRIRSRSEGERTKISISNSGPPIHADAMRRIFDPLFSTKTQGVGLGLAIVKNLVEANGGKISVESGEQGSTFILDFDRAGRAGGGDASG